MEKKASVVIEGEVLDVLVGSRPLVEEEKEEEKAVCGSKIWDIFSSSAVGDTFISSFAGNRVFLDGQSWPECLRSKTGGCPGTDAGFFRIGE